MKILDVGAGHYKYPGSVSIDMSRKVNPDIYHDLNSYPWPLKDSEFDMIYSSHCLEHLRDAKRALEEIWRVGKDGAEIVIKVPHFSSRVAWRDIEHVRAFSIDVFRRFTPEMSRFSETDAQFRIEKIKLRWQPKMEKAFMPDWARLAYPLIRLADIVITAAANLSAEFCERIWCYYVGGMGEIEFRVRIVKNRPGK